jgi:hypothetical protein
MIAANVQEIEGTEINVLRQQHSLSYPSPQWSNPSYVLLLAFYSDDVNPIYVSDCFVGFSLIRLSSTRNDFSHCDDIIRLQIIRRPSVSKLRY